MLHYTRILNQIIFYDNFWKNVRVFSSHKSNCNQYYIFLYGINSEIITLVKNALYGFFYTLIDIVGVDVSKFPNYHNFFVADGWDLNMPGLNRVNYYYTYDIKTNSRPIFVFLCNQEKLFPTLEYVFSNSNWLERELIEFFGTQISNRNDTRNLLLDYSSLSNPLLKSYPTEGHQEIFFNYTSYNLEYAPVEFIEL